ncbi:hypothetical protein GF339_07725 [candidate division KSB3 bacterium]|uniref:DUF1468 domain-containing protein n=1 Tax=candidate division KSB3 bacterium TaxID=2044937 RepID=A0A9D5JUP3_9BACT|nr:hypothetical protein [candidate division KSB3 bacterium]MBD3324460.1 hypothetical protein [candidate division KSB3 bacterium]
MSFFFLGLPCRKEAVQPVDQQSKIDIGVGIVLILLSVAVFALSSGYPMPKSGLPVRAVPRMLAGIITILSVVLIVSAWKTSQQRPPRFEGFTKGTYLILIVIALLIGYILILQRVGFIFSSMALMVILMFVFGERRTLILTSVPIGLVLGLYIIFEKLAMVPLPKGILKGIF